MFRSCAHAGRNTAQHISIKFCRVSKEKKHTDDMFFAVFMSFVSNNTSFMKILYLSV